VFLQERVALNDFKFVNSVSLHNAVHQTLSGLVEHRETVVLCVIGGLMLWEKGALDHETPESVNHAREHGKDAVRRSEARGGENGGGDVNKHLLSLFGDALVREIHKARCARVWFFLVHYHWSDMHLFGLVCLLVEKEGVAGSGARETLARLDEGGTEVHSAQMCVPRALTDVDFVFPERLEHAFEGLFFAVVSHISLCGGMCAKPLSVDVQQADFGVEVWLKRGVEAMCGSGCGGCRLRCFESGCVCELFPLLGEKLWV